MNIEEIIKTRRSTRKFDKKQVPDELVEKIIDAGRYAPSGMNVQAAHFIVIKNPKINNALTELVRSEFAKMDGKENLSKSVSNSVRASVTGEYSFSYNAPVLIILANKIDNGNNIADCSCIMENMMLMANELGLGSCWVNQLKHLNENKEITLFMQNIGMNQDERVYASLAVGYADSDSGLPNRTITERKGNIVTMIE